MRPSVRLAACTLGASAGLIVPPAQAALNGAIVEGRSIGGIAIGMTDAQVMGLAGPPQSKSGAQYNPATPGSGQDTWTFSNLIVILQGGFPAGAQALVNPKVVGRQTQSKAFKTAKHHGKSIGVGSKFADVKTAYPTASCGLSRSVHNGPSIAIGYRPIGNIVSIARNGTVVLKHGNSGVQTISACQVEKGSNVTITLHFAVTSDRSKLDEC